MLAVVVVVAAGAALLTPAGDLDLEGGLHPQIAAAIAECAQLEGEPRERCAFSATSSLGGGPDLEGSDLLELCRRLQTDNLHAWCIERTMTMRNPPATEVCDEVRVEEARHSCRLMAADYLLISSKLDDVLAACDALEQLRDHCYVHLVDKRADHWARVGRVLAREEMQQIVARAPEVIDYHGYGHSLGTVAVGMGFPPWAPNPCEDFPLSTPARLGCEGALRTGYGLTVPGATHDPNLKERR